MGKGEGKGEAARHENYLLSLLLSVCWLCSSLLFTQMVGDDVADPAIQRLCDFLLVQKSKFLERKLTGLIAAAHIWFTQLW